MDTEQIVMALADRYRFERELGRGGMAVVYLAQDLKHGRQVAIKVLTQPRPATADDERFSREIRVAAQLSHPHILTLHDSGEAAGFQYYVMPFVAGESLRDRLDRAAPLPEDEALAIAREVAEALDYAHRAGIIHRDIKPENILLHEGHAVVADFGIARALAPSEGGALTETGLVVGTPAYLSPEQVSGEPLDGRSDLYALGCVLFECLSGERPFGGTSVAALAQRVIQPPPSVRERRQELDEAVDQLLVKTMATDPAQRYATGQELAAALKALSATSSTTRQAAAPPAPAPASDRRAIVVLPFANMSPDPDNEYFSDGLTEEIITDLSKVSALSVISRTSSMQLKGTTKDVRAIGRELGVRYVLEGSVRKAGTSLRITAQLIDAGTDEHLWADKYGGTMDDVFDLQEQVSREIVKALDVRLTREEDRQLADRPIQDARAFELYIQARQEIRRYGEAVERGMRLLEQAIEIEGETAPLMALMGLAKVNQVRSGTSLGMAPLDDAEAIGKSLLTNPEDAHYGHAVLGITTHTRGNMAGAVYHLRLALERDPTDTDHWFHLGIAYNAAGQDEEAQEVSRAFLERDPFGVMALMLAGALPWFVGRAADGIPYLERMVEADPQSLVARWCLGYAYALVDRWDEAARQAAWMKNQAAGTPYTGQLNAMVDAHRGNLEAARGWLDGIVGLDYHHKFHVAESFAMVGATEEALAWLEDSVDSGFTPYHYIEKHCPFLAPLREHPRFAALAAKAKERVETFTPAPSY